MSESDERSARMTLAGFAEALASKTAAPGGGSAAAVTAALGASLISMVARLSLGRARYEAHASLLDEALVMADAARERLLALADEDGAAYGAYLAARRRPRATTEDALSRAAAIRDAARNATSVPLALVQDCHRLVDLIARLAGRSNVNAASDLDVGLLLLEAAARSAALNVVANLPATEDESFSEAVLLEVDQRLRHIQGTAASTRERVRRESLRLPAPA